MNFNSQQLRAIGSTSKRIVVAAGPGSGKSSTLITRVQERIRVGVPTASIWLITFTQAGAKVMSERLEALGITVGYVGTRHGLMYRLLNRYGQRIGYREGGVTLISEDDADELLRQCAKTLGFKGSWKAIEEKRPGTELVWKEFTHRCRRNNSVTYDLALTEGLRIVKLFGAELGVDELLCDESQDNSAIDWQIDEAIQAGCKFWCGDYDQSIFSFRGSYPRGFMEAAAVPGTELILLEANYRSGVNICAAATALISHNRDRIAKDVVPAFERRDHVTVKECRNDIEECNALVARIRQLWDGPKSIAVLVRTNHLAAQFRDAIEASGVPVQCAKRRNLPADFGRALDVISLMVDPRNDLIAERVINSVAPKELEAAKKRARESGEWLSSAAINNKVMPGWTIELSVMLALLPRWNIGRESCDLIAQRARLLPGKATLADLLCDLWSHDRWDPEPEESGVVVSTLHSAKGREFDVVFMPAMEEGLCPSLKRDNDLEEERRLAFVGMTRARHELVLSWALRRKPQFGPVEDRQPSRFIQEAQLNHQQ